MVDGRLGSAGSAVVCFAVGGPSSSFTTGAGTLTRPGTFSAAVSGLDSSTTYGFRVQADGSDGDSGEGDWEHFTTDGSTL